MELQQIWEEGVDGANFIFQNDITEKFSSEHSTIILIGLAREEMLITLVCLSGS